MLTISQEDGPASERVALPQNGGDKKKAESLQIGSKFVIVVIIQRPCAEMSLRCMCCVVCQQAELTWLFSSLSVWGGGMHYGIKMEGESWLKREKLNASAYFMAALYFTFLLSEVCWLCRSWQD